MQSLPYFPISQFYRQIFAGEKVYKISVSVAETCPNREGIRGMQTCRFCDQWGSAAYSDNLKIPLAAQIEKVRATLIEKRLAKKFLVYFQAYTTTFTRVKKLREEMELGLSYPDVVGLVVGTRPDCISDSLLDAFNEMSERTFMAVEMGVQSFDNRQLEWMHRGHSAEDSIKALRRMRERCPKVNLGMHLMFGLPNETDQDVIDAALKVNEIGVQNVKLHHLHVLKNTPLADDYARGEFVPVEREVYFHRTMLFLQNLRKDIAVHRLAAFAPRWDELIAPAWTSHKMKSYSDMLQFMRDRGAYQGQALE
jgi:radical SAM protein (TIGR01212 family)